MSRQYDEAMEGRFDLYGTEYRLIEPDSLEDLVAALEVKAALETHISGLMHDEDSSGFEELLHEQTEYIQEYIDNLGEFDNSVLINNINFFLRKYRLRMGELEQLIGLSAGYISRTAKENSGKKLSIDVVWKLSRFFGVDVKSLIETDLTVPHSNAKMVVQFLDKLCRQTAENEIKWENLGGAICYLDEALKTSGLFAEEDGTTIYRANDHMNPDYKYELADDIYVCDAIAPGKRFAMIGFSIVGKDDSYFLDFVFLTKAGTGSRAAYGWEKAFYSSDDRFSVIQEKAEELMHLVQTQEMDAEISPQVRSIIADYLK